MTGDENGDLHLGKTVTRAEFTKLTVAASAWADSVGPAASVSPYPDVPKSNWAAPYVQVAKEKGMVMGSLSGYFEPDRNITLVEGVTMVLRLLGYQDSDFSTARFVILPVGESTLTFSHDGTGVIDAFAEVERLARTV